MRTVRLGVMAMPACPTGGGDQRGGGRRGGVTRKGICRNVGESECRSDRPDDQHPVEPAATRDCGVTSRGCVSKHRLVVVVQECGGRRPGGVLRQQEERKHDAAE